jgi:hypothetical protein
MAFAFPDYRIPQVSPQAAAVPKLDIAAPALAFGGNIGTELQQAGQATQKAVDGLLEVARRGQTPADETRVEQEVNAFMAAGQQALYFGDKAFMHLKGQQAIDAAPALLARFDELRRQALGRMANDNQRRLLSQRLDAQYKELQSHINGRLGTEVQREKVATADQRAQLNIRESRQGWADPGRVDGLAQAQAGVATEQAQLKFGAAPDSDVARSLAEGARAEVYRAALGGMLEAGRPQLALGLWDRVKDTPGFKGDDATAALMHGVGDRIVAGAAIDEELARIGSAPLGDSFRTDLDARHARLVQAMENRNDLDPAQRNAALTRLDRMHVEAVSRHEVALRSLVDEADAARRGFALDPASLPPDALAGFAARAAALGEPELAARYRALAGGQGTLADTIQSPPADQQRQIARIEAAGADDPNAALVGALKEIVGHQQAAFAHDALLAGSRLYAADLGPLPPIDDLAARAAYAAHVSARRGGIDVLPFTQAEIAGLRQRLDTAPPAERERIVRALAVLPAAPAATSPAPEGQGATLG